MHIATATSLGHNDRYYAALLIKLGYTKGLETDSVGGWDQIAIIADGLYFSAQPMAVVNYDFFSINSQLRVNTYQFPLIVKTDADMNFTVFLWFFLPGTYVKNNNRNIVSIWAEPMLRLACLKMKCFIFCLV